MRIFFKIIFVLLFISIAFSLFAYYFWYKPKFKETKQSFDKPIKRSSEEFARLKTKTFYLKKYIAANHYNSKICFLVDMSLPSGKNRFFIYDLQNDSVILSGLVAHGSCDNGFQPEASFSNKENSGCSCLGKFKIGGSYNGRFGLAYHFYMGSILPIATLAKEQLFYTLMNVFLTRKLIHCRFVIAGDARWFHQRFYKN